MPFTQEFVESLIKQNQMQLEQIVKCPPMSRQKKQKL